MSAWLIGLVTVIYLAIAVSFLLKGNPGMCLCFVGYCVANVGIIWAT